MIIVTFGLLASLAVQAAQSMPSVSTVVTTVSTTEASPARPKALMPLYFLYGGLSVSQFAATKITLNRGASEANPTMGFNGSPTLQMGVAIGAGALTVWMAEHMWQRGHRMSAIGMMALVIGINGAVLGHDLRWLNMHGTG